MVDNNSKWFAPDLDALKQLSANAEPATMQMAAEILDSGSSLTGSQLASLLKGMLQPGGLEIADLVKQHAAVMRTRLFGNTVIAMAPVEISNTCASDCLFCGWRVSNRAMKRTRMPVDLAMLQVEYLISLGIHYIEFVSGDDITAVREILPRLIRETRALFEAKGIHGKIAFCTLALTENQYRDLRAAGADAMVVWQEAYDPAIFQKHVVGGPKAYCLTEDWKIDRQGDGCRFRIESQERALNAGLEVALGSMLGLNPDICTEFLATVEHTRFLSRHPMVSAEHPIIIGMPVWNAITTEETDLRPADAGNLEDLFPALAALYLLAMPSPSTWVFPNCRVPIHVQIEAAKVAGVFSSTEVKLGPGGYTPAILRKMEVAGHDTSGIRRRFQELLRAGEIDSAQLEQALDEREQFIHHHHAHEFYVTEMAKAGLEIASDVSLPAQV